jgi:hypothetical protein
VFENEKFDFKNHVEKKIYLSGNLNFKSYFLQLFRVKLGLKVENFTIKHTNRNFFLNVL